MGNFDREAPTLDGTARQQIERILRAWPSSRPPDGWRDELHRAMVAAADVPGDITAAVTKAIDETAGAKYAPDIATFAQLVARRRLARIRRDHDREREERRRREPQPAEPWRGWLAIAATHAALHDRGTPATPSQQLSPYLALVLDLGYRNHHGCGDYRDADRRHHPADPDHDPQLAAAALHGAERIWRAHGMPAAPSPAGLTAPRPVAA